MELNKFEEHIKKQMMEREIQPSSNAWERISERLEPTQEKKSNKLWYAVAASFIGILMVSIFYLNSGISEVEPEFKVVDTPEKEIEKVLEEKGVEEKLANTLIVEKEKKEDEKVKEKSANPSPLKEVIDELASVENSTPIVKKDNNNIDIAVHTPSVVSDSSAAIAQSQYDEDYKFDNPFDKTEQLIDVKVSELLATVNQLENGVQDITDSEVDSLLRQAEMELMAENLFQEPSFISATTLLAEVENELDPTFRDRIFESLKNKLLKARTAVATRNN